MLRRPFSAFVVIASVSALVACAGGPAVTMQAADRASIKVVNVTPDVQVKQDFSFQEKGAGMGAVFGVVGAVVEASAAKPAAPLGPKEQLLAMMKANNISLQEIVKTEFVRAASSRSTVKFAEGAAPADANLSMSINVQGLGRTHLLGEMLHPILNITATLKKPDGTVVWQKSDYVSATNPDNAKVSDFDGYMKNPELLRTAFTQAARIVTGWVADGLPFTK
jgi:hypothetical protein